MNKCEEKTKYDMRGKKAQNKEMALFYFDAVACIGGLLTLKFHKFPIGDNSCTLFQHLKMRI